MAIVRWDPTRELDSLQGEMNRLFSTFFDSPTSKGANGNATARRWIPPMDLVETLDQFVLKADLLAWARTTSTSSWRTTS